jgi:branched-chain amino acid transport system permease protein
MTEDEMEFASVIFAFTFVMVFIVPGLSVMASLIRMFKFAHGEFGLLGFSALDPSRWCAICRGGARVGARQLPARGDQICRFYANPIIACSAHSPR